MSQDLDLDDLLDRLPDESRQLAGSLWRGLPPDLRRELDLTLRAFLKVVRENPGAARDLVHLLSRQAAPALRPLSSVAVVGPVNAGKSTLYNALLAGTAPAAATSAVPGTTRQTQEAGLGPFRLVDTPGADHGAATGGEERAIALEAARRADFLLIVFDASRSVLASDQALYHELAGSGRPHLVALNKIDLVPARDQDRVLASAAAVLSLRREEIHPTSARSGQGIQTLLLEAAAAEPRLLGELGRALPGLRRKLAWQAVRRAALGACLVSLTPIPVVDLLPLAGLQSAMVLTLARIYDQELSLARAREVLPSLGFGLLARTMFQQLSKLGGVPGWALSASIAGAATVSLGFGAILWFETGRRPEPRQLQEIAATTQRGLLGALNPFGRRRPGRRQVEEALSATLPNLPPELEADPPAPSTQDPRRGAP